MLHNFVVDPDSRTNLIAINDINYHYEVSDSLRFARNIINKSRGNARAMRPAGCYERFLFLMLRINLLQKFYLHRVYP